MSRVKSFIVFLVLLLLASTFVAVSHNHENTVNDHDCPICVVSHHQQATSESTVAFDGVPFIVEAICLVPAPASAKQQFTSSLNNRAPPA